MVNDTQQIPAGYKQTDVGVIPEDWESKRLDDVFSITAGRDLVKEAYSPIKNSSHPYPIYSNSLDNNGIYGYTSNARYESKNITITARGTVGHSNARFSKFDAIGRLLVLKPAIKLDCFFISEYINNRVKFSIESTGVPQLTAPQASKYQIAFPSYIEQSIIASTLKDIDSLISKLDQLIQKKKNIKY